MDALKTTECIRKFYPAPYVMAVRDELLLRVLTESMLSGELLKICWDKSDEQKNIGLFTDAGRGDGTAQAAAKGPALAVSGFVWPVAALAAAVGLLLSARRGRGRGGAVALPAADDVECRLVEESIE